MSNFPEPGFRESGSPEIGFAPLAPEHLTVLHSWLQRPHVRAYWDDGHRTLVEVQAHYFAPDSEYADWRSPLGETWGLDLLLGEVTDTGRGLGPRVVSAFVEAWRARRPSMRRVLIDPDVRNLRAINACRKAGFVPLGEYFQPPARLLILALKL